MTKWYAVNGYSPEIEVLNVVKETEKTLSYQPKYGGQPRRTLKRDTFTACFPTWKEAHDSLIMKMERKIKIEEDALDYLREKLETARQLKEEE